MRIERFFCAKRSAAVRKSARSKTKTPRGAKTRVLQEMRASDSEELRCNDVGGLRFWWCLFFRNFGLHQARNVQRHRASFFLGLVSQAAAHGSGNLLAGKPALAQGGPVLS